MSRAWVTSIGDYRSSRKISEPHLPLIERIRQTDVYLRPRMGLNHAKTVNFRTIKIIFPNSTEVIFGNILMFTDDRLFA